VLRAPVLVAIAAAVVACSPGSSPATSTSAAALFESGSELLSALASGGVQCSNPRDRSPATNVKEQLGCEIDGQDVIVRVFDDAAARDRYVQAGAALMSQLDVEVDAPATVIGPNWIVTTDTPELAKRVQGAIGGEVGG